MHAISTQQLHATTDQGWRARLEMRFDRPALDTVLRQCRHYGPLRVQRTFHPEQDGTCHVYLLHPPGGVVGGDSLEVDVVLESDAQALITTPGATKIYRSSGAYSSMRQRLTVANGARLEWLPQETIAFEASRSVMGTVVQLAPGAVFAGWEILCLGRPAAGEAFRLGDLRQGLEVWREKCPVFSERLHLRGGEVELSAAWGMGGRTVMATFVIACNERGLVARVRKALGPVFSGEGRCSASQLEGAAVFRILGDSARSVQRTLMTIWQVARSGYSDCPAEPPRIWST